jgi:hypothetical protein
MAAIGSLYIVWATDGDIIVYEKSKAPRSTSSQSDRSGQPRGRSSHVQDTRARSPREREAFPRFSNEQDLGRIPTINEPSRGPSPDEHIECVFSTTPGDAVAPRSNAGRGKVRNWLERASTYMSDAAHDKLDTSDYRDEKAHTYPQIPGENLRNELLHRTSTGFEEKKEEKKRAASYASSTRSAREAEGPSTPPAETLSRPDADSDAIVQAPRRRDTLEVPPVAYHSPKTVQEGFGGG